MSGADKMAAVTVDGGKLTISGTSTISNLNVNAGAGSIVDIVAGSLTIDCGGGSGLRSSTGGTVNGSGGGTLTFGQGSSSDGGNNGTANGTILTINAIIAGTSCYESFYGSDNTGVTVLNATNTFSGNVFINAGVLSAFLIGDQSVAGNLGAGTTINIGNGTANTNGVLKYTGAGETNNRVINLAGTTAGAKIDQSGAGGTLKFTSNFTAGGAGSKTLTLQGSTAGIGEIAGVIPNNSGANKTSVTKAGTGTWILSGVNTFSGDLAINAGKIEIGGAGQLGSGTYAGAISNNALLVYNSSAEQILSGAISSTGSLTKLGSGALTLSGTNTYTGTTTISNGTLTVSDTGSIKSSTNVVVEANTVLVIAITSGDSIGDTARVILKTGSPNGIITISNNVTESVGSLYFEGVAQAAGTYGSSSSSAVNKDDTRFAGTGMLSVGTYGDDGSWANNASDGPWSTASNWTNNVVPFGPGKTAYFTNAITGNRAVSIDASSVFIGNMTFGSPGAYNWTLNDNSIFLVSAGVQPIVTVNAKTATIYSVINGYMGFVKSGSGTLTLAGTNIYTGSTRINAGNLFITNDINLGNASAGLVFGGGTLMTTNDVTLNRSVTLNATGIFSNWLGSTLTVPNPITGAYGVTKYGSGTLLLSGANTYSGSTVIMTNGTITVAGSGSINNSGNSLLIRGGGTFTIQDTASATFVNLFLGEEPSGISTPGNVNHISGAITVSGHIRVGHWPAETSTYTMSGGTLTITSTTGTNPFGSGDQSSGVLYLGIDGTGIFTQNGGDVNVQALVLDNRGDTSGTDTYTLTDGTLTLGRWGIQGNASTLVNLGGGVVKASTNWTGTLPITFTGTGGDTTFETSAGGNITLSGALSGAGGFNKTGAGMLRLTGTSTYSGTTVVSNGVLNGSSVGAFGGTTNITVESGAQLVLENTGNVINDNASIYLNSGSTMYLTNDVVEVVSNLYLNGVLHSSGTWGAVGSVADNTDAHFVGNGVLVVGIVANNGSWVIDAAGGNWSVGANWTNNVIPFGYSKTAYFTNAITGDRVVTQDFVAVSLGNMTFGSPGIYNWSVVSNQIYLANVTAPTITVNTNTATIASLIGGQQGFSKAGSGTLVLSGTNSYVGTTTITGGTLTVGINNAIPTNTALMIGNTNGAGSLNIGNYSQAVTNLIFGSSGSSKTNTVLLGSGTLTVNGNVFVGQDLAATTYSLVKMTGVDGTFQVVKTGGTFQVSAGNTVNSGGGVMATMDMSGLGTAVISLGAGGKFYLGDTQGINTGNDTSTLLLASNTTITAATITIGPGGRNFWQDMRMGSGSTVLNAGSVNIGTTSDRDSGQLVFNSVNGTLTIRGLDGVGRGILNMGVGIATTGGSATDICDLRGHNVDLLLSLLTIGEESRGGASTYTFYFDTGIIDTTGLRMGGRPSAGIPNADNSKHYYTANIGGGAITIGTSGIVMGDNFNDQKVATIVAAININGGAITVDGGISMFDQRSTKTAISNSINLASGSLKVSGDIITKVSVGSPAARTAILTLNGGTLDMQGHNIGRAPSTNRVDVLNFQSGKLMNVAEINGGGSLVKTTSGTLVIDGTNTFTAETIVSNGVLNISTNGFIASSTSIVVGVNAQLTVENTGNVFSDDATVDLKSGGGYGKMYLTNGLTETVRLLFFDGLGQASGTWGSTASAATHKDDNRFAGAGVLNVLHAGTGSWGVDAGGNWSASGNWVGSMIPYGSYSTAYFTNAITVNRVVTQDYATLTLGSMTFGSPGTCSWAVSNNPVYLVDATTPIITVNANTAAVASAIGGGQGFIKNGSGTLVLSGANVCGGIVTVSNGELRISGGVGALPGIVSAITQSGGAMVITNATVTLASSTSSVFGVGCGFAGIGTVVVDYGGVLNVGNGLSRTFVGGGLSSGGLCGEGVLTINNGAVNIGAGGGWPNDKVYIGGFGGPGGTINLNGGVLTSARMFWDGVGDSSIINLNGGTLRAGFSCTTFLDSGLNAVNVLSGGAVIDSAGYDITVAEPLKDGGGNGGLIKLGSGTLRLTGANTYIGTTVVSNGFLRAEVANSLGSTTNVTVESGAQLVIENVGNVINDNASIYLKSGSTNCLTNSAIEVVGSLYLNGVLQSSGIWGAVGSGANNTDSHFTGNGMLVVGVGTNDGAWAVDAGGAWRTASNWTNNVVPFGVAKNAYFTNNISGDRTVDVDYATVLIGNMTFGSPDVYNWTLTNNQVFLTNSTVPVLTVTSNTATIASVIIGGQGVIKRGAGTLVLGAANTYKGATTINNGILTLGVSGALPSSTALTLGDSATNVNAGQLDMAVYSQTLGTLAAIVSANNNAKVTNSIINLASGMILNVSTNASGNTVYLRSGTHLQVSGSGAMNIVTTNGDMMIMGRRDADPPWGLDLSQLGSFSAFVKNIYVGYESDGVTKKGLFTLAGGSNNITASTIYVGCAFNAGSVAGQMSMGTTNVLNVADLYLGYGKANGTLMFSSGLTTPKLLLAGTNGMRANVYMGRFTQSGSATQPTGNLMITNAGSSIDAQVNELVLGSLENHGTVITAGGSGYFRFGGGTVDVNTVVIGRNLASYTMGVGQGVLTMDGGILNVNTQFTLAQGTVPTGTISGTLILNGGVANIYTNITGGGGTSILTLSGATLDMHGYRIGNAVTNIGTLNFQSGKLKNVAEINQGGALVKTTSGTLVIDGVNTFTAGIVVSNGVLDVSTTGFIAFSTNISVEANAQLTIQNTGNVLGDSTEVDLKSGGGYGKMYLTNGVNESIGVLRFNGVAQARGTWGSTASAATHKDDNYFSGIGVLTILIGTDSWGVDANGNWSVAANWVDNSIAQGQSSVAYFTNAVTANRVVTQDYGTLTLGSMTFGSPGTYSWLVTNNPINLQSTKTPIITVNANTATVSSVIGGAQGFIKVGSGTLVLTGSNTYSGSTSVSNGTMILSGGGYLSNSLYMRGASTFTIQDTASAVFSYLHLGEWVSSAGNFNQTSGTVTVTAQLRVGHYPSETSTYTMSGGVLSLTDPAAINPFQTAVIEYNGAIYLGIDGTGVFIQNGGDVSAPALVLDNRGDTAGTDTYTLNAGTLTLGKWGIQGNASTLVNFGGGVVKSSASWTGTLPITLTDTGGSTTFDTTGGNISLLGVLSSVGGFNKVGTGTLNLSGSSTYSGTTIISNGTLLISDAGSIASSTNIVVEKNGLLSNGSSSGNAIGDSARLVLNSDATTTGKVFLAGSIVEAVGSLYFNAVSQAVGTWGSSLSYAVNKDDAHFDGTGMLVVGAYGDDGSWTNDASGDWSVAGNWNNSIIAHEYGKTATFACTITADRTVSEDYPMVTIGNMTFGSVGSYNWVVTNNMINLAGFSTPTINVTSNVATIASVLSGVKGFTKSGPGLLVLSNTNNLGGTVTISKGVLYITNDVNLRYSTNLTLSGGTLWTTNNITFSNRTVTVSGVGGAINVEPGSSLTVTNSITGGSALYKYGLGSLVMASNTVLGNLNLYTGTVTLASTGTNTFQIASIYGGVAGATMNVNGPAKLTDLIMGNRSGDRSVVTITTNLYGNRFSFGDVADSAGAIYQTGGVVTQYVAEPTTSDFAIGDYNNSFGYYRMAGGALNISGVMYIGGANNNAAPYGGCGVFDMSGGSVLVNWLVPVRNGIAQAGVLNISGGVMNLSGSTNVECLRAGNYNQALINIMGSGVLNSAPNGRVFDLMNSSGSHTGVVNLLSGGTLIANRILATAAGTTMFNFNGGILQSDPNGVGALGPTFLQGLTVSMIYSNGAVIDSGTNVITIGQSLMAPTDYGITNIAISSAGAGYIGTPIVVVSGGNGAGATAIALVNLPAGTVTNILITSPGSGYQSGDTLTATLRGGGYTTPATLGAVTLGTNTGGGLVKIGSGKLAFSSTCTYGGVTIVSNGVLDVLTTGSIVGSTNITIESAGRLTIQNTGDVLFDSATVNIKTGGKLYLTNSVNEAVGRLYLNGECMESGAWGASGSGCQFTNDSYFIGSGVLNVLGSYRGGAVIEIDAAPSTNSTLPFAENFESYANNTPLNGTGKWGATLLQPDAFAEVKTNSVYSGNLAGRLYRTSRAWHGVSFTEIKTNAWVDFYLYTHRRDLVGDAEPDLNTNTSVALYINKYGQVVARSNTSWVAFATPVIPTGQWSRFSLSLDYSNKLWSIYLAGPITNALAVKVASDLAFAHTNFVSIQSWQATCGTNTMMFLDNLSIAASNSAPPLSIDSDGDGLPDWWETVYFGGSTTGDANADGDGDGVKNLYEYIAGTDPTNVLSYMHVSVVDIPSPASSDINVAVLGGDKDPASSYSGDSVVRYYSVLAANGNATNAKTVVVGMSNIVDNLTGTNVFTDVNAVNIYSNRWYSVMVSRGGVAYTNTDEWAMYVQNRQPKKEYLVCVPVDCSGTNVNNLNSLLGRQLGRGLYAANTNISGDRLRYLKDDGTWAEYYLATNADNTIFWWDSVTKTAANVNVTAGMAFWLVSGDNAGLFRTNAVFAGKSFTLANVVPFTMKTNRWNMFGWPLPRTRSVVNTEAMGRYTTPSNQLGFELMGSAGITADSAMTTNLGDQIWIWKNDTWVNWCWLVGHFGTNWDGRWWDENTSTFASFRFEPGMGYYYYHPTNQWGGTNFVWTPQY